LFYVQFTLMSAIIAHDSYAGPAAQYSGRQNDAKTFRISKHDANRLCSESANLHQGV